MVNSSRYLGADDGLKLQQQALSQTAQAGMQATASANEGVQAYLQGAVRNSQRLVELEQTRYAIEAQAASRPNQFSELVKAGVSIATEIRQQQKKEEQLKLQQKQAIASTQKYAQLDTELSNLVAKYDQENWDKGIEGFNSETSALLGKYAPTTPEEAKEWASYVSKASDARQRRSRQVQERVQQVTDEQLKASVDTARANLTKDLTPQFTALANEGFTAEEQAQPRIDAVYKYLDNFRKIDNGLPDYKKDQLVAEFLNQMYASYGRKLERYTQWRSGLNNYRLGVNEKLRNRQDYLSGKLDEAGLAAADADVDQRFPEASKFSMKPWEAENIRVQLSQLEQTKRDLVDKRANTLASQITLDPASVQALAAAAYLDPTWSVQNLENGTFANIPGSKAAVALAQRLRQYAADNSSQQIQNSETRISQLRTYLQSTESVVDFSLQIAKQKAANQPLTPDQQALQGYINQISGGNPGLAAIIRAKLTPGSPPVPEEDLRRANLVIQQAQQSILQEQITLQATQRAKIREDYQDLFNAGLIDANGNINRELLLKKRQTAPDVLNNLNQTYNKLKLEAQQQIQPTYGIQPNFSESSSFAPIVDDKGKLVLVPRASAQTIKVNGQQIVTPVIAGSSAPLTSRYGFRKDPITGATRFHAGIDLSSEGNEKSIALISGTVVHVGSANGYGNFIDVLGDNGLVYRYAHQRSFVKIGQRVKPGQPISVSDGSGRGTGDHLHFEVRYPQFTDGKYDVNKNYGRDNSLDPIAHLQQLSANSSNVLTPRGNTAAFRNEPTFKVPGNSTLLSNAGALNAGNYQRAGSVAGKSVQRFSGQRPARTGVVKAKVKIGQHQYDFGDDMGYAELRKDPELMRAFHQTAKNLGVPAEWIADIARQESGGLDPHKDHNGNNYGLFGFGRTSFHDKSIHSRLRAGKVNGVEQLKLYERYLKENGWEQVVKSKQGNITIADLWAFTRMGWNERKQFWSTGDTRNIKHSPTSKLTYQQELELLGKWVGRQYDFNDRLERNKAVSSNFDPHCQICNSMKANGSFVPHVHRR